MTRRLLLFLALFVSILAALELFVRANGASFEALSDRLAFQIRVFERSPEDTAALFLGTSRFADAIDQTVFSDAVSERVKEDVRAVNGAMGGINLGEIMEFAEVVVDSPSLPRVIVEVSGPSVTMGTTKSPDPSSEDLAMSGPDVERFPDRFENRLQGWFLDHSSLVRYRKALRPRTFLRLAILYSANFVDPGKWARKGVIRELLTSSDFEIPEEAFAALIPVRFSPDSPAGKHSFSEEDLIEDPVFQGMVEIAEILKESSAEVTWVAPPVSEVMQPSEGGAKRRAIYERIARDYEVTILDYSGISFDPAWFRDQSHLNEKGRTLFSRLVARDLSSDW